MYIFIHIIQYSGRWLPSAMPPQEKTVHWVKEEPEVVGMSLLGIRIACFVNEGL